MPYKYTGIVVAREGTLYASAEQIWVDPDAAICDRFGEEGDPYTMQYTGVARNLTPCETACCGTEDWDYLIAGTSSDEQFRRPPSSLKICGCLSPDTNSVLWAIDTKGGYYDVTNSADFVNGLWSYEDCAAKTGPVLTSPADGTVIDCAVCADCLVTPFTLKWERMCLACSYDIEIMDEDGNLIWDYYDVEISGDPPEYYLDDAALYCGNTYTWHIREANTSTGECVHSPWSETWSFTISASAFNSVMLIAPEVGAMGVPLSGVGFSWSSVSGATSYSFVLSPNADLSGALATSDQSGTAYSYSGTLDNEVSYYWQVTAWKDGIMLSQSDIGTFSTAPEEIAPLPYPEPGEAPVINIPPTQQIVPMWIYAVIGIGAGLAVVVIILIVKKRSSS
jgi:hypothetical protein